MNKNELMAKIEAMKNKKAQSAANTDTIADAPQIQPETPAPIQTPTERTAPAKMKSFTILWHEGTNEFEDTTVTTWNEAQSMMLKIYDEEQKYTPDGCYTKVKICVKWSNGKEITDRCDIGTSGSDFNPSIESIGEYLSKCKGVMYASNLVEGERVNLSFADQDSAPTQPEPQPKNNLQEVPDTLKKLLGIVETIEESGDNSEQALIQASEQVERCKAYITYLRSILPILEAKTEAMIYAKHKPAPIEINQTANHNLN